MRNSFSFDLKILKETDNLIKVGMLFQSLAPKYFIDLRAYRNVFLMVKNITPSCLTSFMTVNSVIELEIVQKKRR